MLGNGDENDGLRPKRGVAMNLTYSGVPTSDYDNGRDEKPWQRVPSTYIVILLAWYLLLAYLMQLVEDAMPTPVMNADLARDDTSTFSEESARQYLDDILGNAPRVAGTVYHLDKTRDMKAIVDGIAARANQAVHTDWQMASGDYFHSSSSSFLNVYENASNVIAVLEGESGFLSNGTIGSSVLVNCHYDSVPFAMGASDNAIFCAVMAEVLSKLSRRTRKLKHNIVFLFNGAEENGLQASHGFLQHAWAQGIKTVVNLDSAGMNGKPSVFQVTDPGTLRAYARSVRFPNAQGLGEFLFSSGIIPSDTDFRIFRDFGNIHGIDIAFTKWGVVYHTRYDNTSLVRTGVIQHAGDMILAVLSELGDSGDIEPAPEPTPVIYFDFLNLFLVRYTFAAAYVMDTFITVLGLLTVGYYVWLVGFRWSTVRELLLSVSARVVAVISGVVVVAIFTALMVATTVQLRYLSEPWLVVPLYWIPYFIGAVAASQAFDAWRTKKSGLNRTIRSLQAQAATRFILSIISIIMLCIPSLATARYLVTAPLCIMSIMSLVSLTSVRYVRLKASQHLLLESLLSLPTTMFVLTLALRLDAMLLPITGRSDSADFVIAIINVGMAIIISATVSGIELLFSRKRLWLPLSLVGAVCVVLMFIPFAPYRGDGPATMRHYWFHTEIVTFDQNKVPSETLTGVMISKMDANTISDTVQALQSSASVSTGYSAHCEDRVYCDLPLYRTTFAKNLPKALFVYMDGPAQFSPRPHITYTRQCAQNTCSYLFTVVGTSHNTVTIWPNANVTVTRWSYSAPLTASFTLQDRPVYVIVHSVATYPVTKPWQFSLQCDVSASLQSQPSLRVSLHAHKIYHPEDFTSQYKSLMNAMPHYYNIATFLSYRYNYVV